MIEDALAVAALALARRFAAGGAMWCASPRWPAHADHVAVEFVHPVIVGKRALPAAPVEDPDVLDAMRLLVRAGDVVLAIGAADDHELAAVCQRSDAWGVTSVWIGAGAVPTEACADHVRWLDRVAVEAADTSADIVLLYHLLWELTHVVFEHPGLLAPPADCTDDVCITCSDEGRVAEVAAVLDGQHAVVRAGGRSETIDTTLVDLLKPGDLVLVHAGTAITLVEDP